MAKANKMIFALLLTALSFKTSTSIAAVDLNSKISELKHSDLAGNLLGASTLGQFNVVTFDEDIVLADVGKNFTSIYQLGERCSVSANADDDTQVIKAGTSYGILFINSYNPNTLTISLRNIYKNLNNTEFLTLNCEGIDTTSTVEDLIIFSNGAITVE